MAVTSEKIPKKGTAVKKEKIQKADAKDIFMEENEEVAYSERVDPKNEILAAVQTIESNTKSLTGGRMLLKMERENVSYTTPEGVRFSKEHPYQTVEEEEGKQLLRLGFREATPSEVVRFYEE